MEPGKPSLAQSIFFSPGLPLAVGPGQKAARKAELPGRWNQATRLSVRAPKTGPPPPVCSESGHIYLWLGHIPYRILLPSEALSLSESSSSEQRG